MWIKLKGWFVGKCLISGFFFFKFSNLIFFIFKRFIFISHINHIGNWWDDRDGDDAPNLYLTMALPNYNAWRGFEAYVLRVNSVFASLSKICQKLYEFNEFYIVRRWRWIKLSFPQNPDFVVLYSNFVQNQVTAPCNNCLAWHVLKDRSSFSILSFL